MLDSEPGRLRSAILGRGRRTRCATCGSLEDTSPSASAAHGDGALAAELFVGQPGERSTDRAGAAPGCARRREASACLIGAEIIYSLAGCIPNLLGVASEPVRRAAATPKCEARTGDRGEDGAVRRAELLVGQEHGRAALDGRGHTTTIPLAQAWNIAQMHGFRSAWPHL